MGIAVLSEMAGLEVHSNRTIGQLLDLFRSLPMIHWLTVAISTVSQIGVFAFSRFAPQSSGLSDRGHAGAIAASASWDFYGHGIAIIGSIVGGFRI